MKDTLPDRVRLGTFELNLRAGELREGERIVRLQEQPFQILVMLVERAGDVVTRDEIQKKLWPNDTIVEFDHCINAAIKKLRQALGDSADEPKYIETIARRGYRLLAAVERVGRGEDSSSAETPLAGSQEKSERSATGRAHPESAASNLVGKQVSHYVVLEAIGGGGMGVVYEAEDLKLGRRVAVKFLPPELALDASALRRFQLEARAASSLDHANICTIYEVEEHQGQPFIVMQLLHGETLRARLSAQSEGARTLSQTELLSIAIGIAQGLQAAHEKGIVHRDIKPANIFLTRGGQVKILDFGLAKLTKSTEGHTGNETAHLGAPEPGPVADTNLTRLGTTMGTSGYMSPEQVRGEVLDVRTDIFSFGLVLYEMATGKRAFSGDTAAGVRASILYSTPAESRQLNPELPPRLQKIIDRALCKDREQRYQSVGEMLADLEAAGRHRPLSRAKKALAAVTILLLAIAGGVIYHRLSQRSRTSGDKDTVVIADFMNTTGEPVFDGTLRQALTIQLEQSPFLQIVSDQKIRETLKLMNRPDNEALTATVAREVCLRSNGQTLLAGSISAIGKDYLLAVKAVACKTGDTLASAEAEAVSREKVVKAVNQLGNQLREKLGESPATREKFNAPLEEATTSSLEALEAYTRAQKAGSLGGGAVIPYLERAVELDPNFARAYATLGTAYYNLQQESSAVRNITKAYQLRSRVSDRERFAIEGAYYGLVTGELPKAVQTYKEWIQSYPGDFTPHADLGLYYARLGNWPYAAAAMQEESRLAPAVFCNANLLLAYVVLGRLEDAQAMFDQARPQDLEDPSLHESRYLLAFLQGNKAAMQEQLDWAAAKPGIEDRMHSMRADTESYFGRIAAARQFSRLAVDSARHAGAAESAAAWKAMGALREAEVGNVAQARAQTGEALAMSKGRTVRILVALALARIGDDGLAGSLADGLNQELPLDTSVQSYWLPSIRAAIALHKRDAAQGVALLELASPYELGWQPPFELGPMYPVYLRGLAFLQEGQGQAAASEFRKMIDHPGNAGNYVLAALARLQLGRAQAMMGDKAAARKSYQDFLALWQDADPDIPMYQQAKVEYAKIQ